MIQSEQRLQAGDAFSAQASAIDYSAFIGSLACDTLLDLQIAFSNDEVDENGNYITNKTLPQLHYDVISKTERYDPSQPHRGLYVIPSGRWVQVKLFLKETPSFLRFYFRGRTF